MTQIKENSYPDTGINHTVSEVIKNLPDLSGKIVLDIPCGDGRASYEFVKRGARVKAFDLFPDFMQLKEIKAEYADLAEPLPLGDDSVDYVICQEGIEHVPNQLKVLQEFNRVLKPDGMLLITTPNCSHVRARLSHFFFESDYWKKMPPTEVDSIWFAEDKSNKLYFGHFFLMGVQHFQSLLTISGFQVQNRVRTELGNTSLALGILLYPLFAVVTFISWALYRGKNKHIAQSIKDRVFWERVKLNLSPKTLFCKHVFWVSRKRTALKEVTLQLKSIRR